MRKTHLCSGMCNWALCLHSNMCPYKNKKVSMGVTIDLAGSSSVWWELSHRWIFSWFWSLLAVCMAFLKMKEIYWNLSINVLMLCPVTECGHISWGRFPFSTYLRPVKSKMTYCSYGNSQSCLLTGKFYFAIKSHSNYLSSIFPSLSLIFCRKRKTQIWILWIN